MNNYIAARAAQILIIINECGEKSDLTEYAKVFKGTTKLEKYDFLIRYPEYLREIIEKENPGVDFNVDQPNLEEDFRAWTLGMIKYKYGPFESELYETLGHLEARGLIRTINSDSRRDFYLTIEGEKAYLEKLVKSPIHTVYIERARLIKKYLIHLSLPELMDHLYKYPQIREAQLGESIDGSEGYEY
jgi:hypothetical protein